MPLRILLVDDVELVRRLLRTVLTDAGHIVVAEAEDGRAGVQQAEALRPDLVIMDWSMPVLDGVAATRAIRECCPGVTVIAFSSASDPGAPDGEEPLTIVVRRWPALARTHLALRGALQAGSAQQLPAAVDQHSVRGDRITLDLSEITAIDKSGVSAIDACAQLARARDAQLEVQHPSRVVRRALSERGTS